MSHIPNSAMPHAVDPETAEEFETENEDEQPSRGERARAMFREHPRTSAAAGAALIAGITAAAAAPFLANRKKAAPKAKRAAPAKAKTAAPAKKRSATSTRTKTAGTTKAPAKRKPAAKRTTAARNRTKKPS
jgi:hypothetical protein